MSIWTALFGSSDPAAYAGRESASARAARKAAERAARDRAASRGRHKQQGAKVQRDAQNRGWT